MLNGRPSLCNDAAAVASLIGRTKLKRGSNQTALFTTRQSRAVSFETS